MKRKNIAKFSLLGISLAISLLSLVIYKSNSDVRLTEIPSLVIILLGIALAIHLAPELAPINLESPLIIVAAIIAASLVYYYLLTSGTL